MHIIQKFMAFICVLVIFISFAYAFCNDGVMNGDEEGVDCGGSCYNECFFDGWRALIVRSQEDYEQDLAPGEGMQCPHSMVRSYSNPEYVYWALDCGQGWRSTNGGETWERMLSKGIGSSYGQSIEVDPMNPKTVFLSIDNSWKTSEVYYSGLYKSTDRGDNWDFVLNVSYDENNRMPKHNIAYALDSVVGNRALIWYAAFANNTLYKSTDGGDNWILASDLTGHTLIYALYVRPDDSNTLFLGSNNGLYKSIDGGVTLNQVDSLPLGEVTTIQINNQNPNEMYIVVKNNGLYKSTDGGDSFTLMISGDLAIGAYINQGYPEVIYFIDQDELMVSMDAGETWTDLRYHPREGLGRDSGYGSSMSWSYSSIIPNPNSRCEAVGFGQCYLWKTDNCTEFYHSNNYFSGYAWTCRDSIMFDSSNPNRTAHFGADMGLFISENSGQYYDLLETNMSILTEYGYADNSNDFKAGAFQPGTKSIVASGGNIWGLGRLGIMFSFDKNGPWEITHLGENIFNASLGIYGAYSHFFYNPDNSSELFVSDIKSNDGGKNYDYISFLSDNDLEVYGMCRSNSSILYAGDETLNDIYRSDDGGKSWFLYVSKSWVGNSAYDVVFDIDPINCDKIYTIVAQPEGERDLGSYNGTDWECFGLLDYIRGLPDNANLIALFPSSYAWQKSYPDISRVIVDPNNGSVIYAASDHPGTSSVYRSVDSGKNWEDISYNLPRIGASAISIDPNSGELFVNPGCSGTWVLSPPYNQTTNIYMNSISRPSCSDGLQNGDETAVDSGDICDEVVIPTATCSDTDTSCGVWPNCVNCNLQDTCFMGDFVDYSCNSGICEASVPLECDDFDICTTDSCSSSGCSNILVDLDGSESCCQAYNFWLGNGDQLNCCGDDPNEANPYEISEVSCYDGSDNDCDGYIDCSDSDCSESAYCSSPNIPLGYISYWRFEGDGNDENLVNNATLIGDYKIVSGVSGNAVNLQGDEDYIVISSSDSLNNLENDVTLSFWYNSTFSYNTYSFYAQLFRFYYSEVDRIDCSYQASDGIIRCFEDIDETSSSHDFDNCPKMQNNSWTHLAFIFNGTHYSVYVDGAWCESDPLSANLSRLDNGFDIRIGSTDDLILRDFNGSFDEVVLYDRVLNSSEILDLYESQKPKIIPIMNIAYPESTVYSSNITAINYTVTNGESCWYSTDSGATNSSSVSAGTNWIGLNLGSSALIVYCNSSDGNIGSDSVSFAVNSCTPSLTNTSWLSPYVNGSCRPDNTLQYIQNLTQYDANSCGEVANITYFQENRTEACVYNDTTAPNTNASIDIPITQQGDIPVTRWTQNNVSINFSCTDDDSCSNTYYCIDQNNTCDPFNGNTTNGSLINVTEDGVHYVRYGSDDVNDNNESVNVLIVRKAENPPQPLWSNYKNNLTTNFTQYGLHNLTNMTIGLPDKAKIKFLDSVDLVKHNGSFVPPDLDTHINISNNYISVSSEMLEMLNISAQLFFLNVTFVTPKIQKDGTDFTNYTEVQAPNSSNNYTMIINVSGFSTYEVVEGYVAPSNDPPSGGSGGSSSSSAPPPPSFMIFVTDNWQLNNLSKYGINNLNISGDVHRIITRDISEESLTFYLIGQDEVSVAKNSKVLLDVNLNGITDTELVYDKYVSATMAKIKVRRYTKKEEVLIEPDVSSAPKEDVAQIPSVPNIEIPTPIKIESHTVQSWIIISFILGGIVFCLSAVSFVFYEIEHKKRPSCKTISRRHNVSELHIQKLWTWLKKAESMGALNQAQKKLLENGWKRELVKDLIKLFK